MQMCKCTMLPGLGRLKRPEPLVKLIILSLMFFKTKPLNY